MKTIRAYVLAFTASALVANAVLGERGALEMRRAREKHRGAAQSLATLRAENAALRTRVRLLRSDRRTIEAIARRELGLAARGEHVVLVRDARGSRSR